MDAAPPSEKQVAALKHRLTYSTRTSNAEGLLEKELKQRQRRDARPLNKYKKHHRAELTAEKEQAIVDCYLNKGLYQAEVAKLHGVSPGLVSRLVTESKHKPEKFR